MALVTNKKRPRQINSGNESSEIEDSTDKRTKKSRSKSKKRSKRKSRSSNDSDDDKSDEDEDLAPDLNRSSFINVARVMLRCVDMYAKMERVVKVNLYLKEEEEAEGRASDSEEEEDQGRRARRQDYLSELGDKTISRYKNAYNTAIHVAPQLKMLLDETSRHDDLQKVLKLIDKTMKSLRANDTARLRDKIVGYIPPDPAKDVIRPPIPDPSKCRSQMGVNHPLLAGMLCPVLERRSFLIDPEETQKRLENGEIDMGSADYPSFLWIHNGNEFQKDDICNGLFRGYFLERVVRHIFTGPSTWSGDETRGSRASNVELLDIQKVVAGNIAYACVQARYSISSKMRWSETDGAFNYCEFYYSIIDTIEDLADEGWRDELFQHYNKLLFNDGKGRANGTRRNEPNKSENSLLGMMHAQAAVRGAASKTSTRPSTNPSERTAGSSRTPTRSPTLAPERHTTGTGGRNPIPPVPERMTPPLSSPPRARNQPRAATPPTPPVPSSSSANRQDLSRRVSELSDLTETADKENAGPSEQEPVKKPTKKGTRKKNDKDSSQPARPSRSKTKKSK